FLPVDNPISGEDQEENHEARIGDDGYEILCCLGEADGSVFIGAARLFEKKQHGEEHRKDAERRHAKHIFYTDVLVYPGGDIRSGSAADVHQRVVNGIADRPNVFLGGTGCGSNDARLNQRDAESRHSKPERIAWKRSEKVKRSSCGGAGAAGLCSHSYSPSNFFGGKSNDPNYFSAAVVAGRYGNGGTRELQKFCQEFDASLIGAAFDRRSGE